MTNEKCQSVFDKILNYVNNSVVSAKSACPPRKRKFEGENDKQKGSLERKVEDDAKIESEKPSQILPSDICPKKKACCFIKMQDPCAPCCCEAKSSPPPCPPKTYKQQPRDPICGCDLCKKDPGNSKCCDKSTGFRGFPIDPRYFEKV